MHSTCTEDWGSPSTSHLREQDRIIGLSRQSAGAIRAGRNQDGVVHTPPTLVAQRVHGIAPGYKDINNHDELRQDPVLGLLSDTLDPKRTNVALLVGKNSIARFEVDDAAMELEVNDIALPNQVATQTHGSAGGLSVT